MAATHQHGADRLLHVCLLHGGLYVKLGQYISSMNYILPPQYPTVMAACQVRHVVGCCHGSIAATSGQCPPRMAHRP